MNKRLLIVSCLFPNRQEPTKGIFIKQLVDRLLNDFDVRVISPLPWSIRRRRTQKEMHNGIEVVYPRYFMIPKMGRSLYGFFYYFSLARFFRKLYQRFRWDAMIVHWAYPDAFGMVLINHFMKRPLFVYVLGSDINIYTQFFLRRMMITYALKKATKVFSVANHLRDKIVSLGVDENHISVIPTGVDTNLFYPMDKNLCRTRRGLPLEKKIILFVGGLLPVKGLSYFLSAALSLLAKRDDLLFILIGEGKMRSMLQKKISEGRADDKILLLGNKPHAEIPFWMNSADLFCLPSVNEGRPNVVMESLACGRPVVGTAVGDVAHLILQGSGGGYVVPPRESDALSTAIGRALDQTWDPQQLAGLVSEYRWEKSAQKIHAEIMKHLNPEQG